MMEYTLARVVLVVCGVALVAAVISPVTSVYDNGESAVMQDQSETICRMLDSFYASEAEEMCFCFDSLLPMDASVYMDGHIVKIVSGEQEYVRGTEVTIVSDRDHYDSNDCVKVLKDGSSIVIESLV